MTDRNVPGQAVQIFLTERLRHQSHCGVQHHVAAVRRRDSCRLLAPMLQRKQAEIGDIGDIVAGREYTDDATGFSGPVAVKRDGPRGMRQ